MMPQAAKAHDQRSVTDRLASSRGWRSLLILIALMPVLLGSAWVEYGQFHQSRQFVADHARHLATGYASQIASRLNNQFTELDFIARAILGPKANPAQPSHAAIVIINRFLSLHPNLFAFNIQSADGNRILWSTRDQSAHPITMGAAFTPLQAHPNFLLGQDQFARRVGANVLSMRFRVRDGTGRVRYLVGSPYRLTQLLEEHQSEIEPAFRFTVVDQRDGSILGSWHAGHVDFDKRQVDSHPSMIQVPGYPLFIQPDWPESMVLDTYLNSAPLRWIWELGLLMLMAVGTFSLLNLLRQREVAALHLERRSEFSTLLAQINQVIVGCDDADLLLRETCNLAVRFGHLKLAWIGKPDEHGWFVCLAASGDQGYLDDLHISTDPDLPEGLGPTGQTWRDQTAYFNQNCYTNDRWKPWQERARKAGFGASATQPIFRGGDIWAVLNVYHEQNDIWDEDLRILLQELAEDVSRGLDRIDARQHERQLERALEEARSYQRTLFERNAAGIFLVDMTRTIVDVNPAMCEITGYSAEELIGHDTEMLHVNHAGFEATGQLYQALRQGKSWVHQDINLRRKDGSVMVVQLLGSRITLPQGEPGVLWSMIDITTQKKAQEQIRHQATHDMLTHLPNRRALEEHLPRALARARRSGTVVAVGMLDLDDFKPVNDLWGHEAGDRLLQELTRRLLALLRESDLLVRVGGDEFVIVLEDLEAEQAIEQLTVALERLHQAVETPFDLMDSVHAEVGMTLGIALFPFDGEDADSLLRQADASMYQSKEHKHDRNRWWRHGAMRVEQPESEQEVDAYGSEARTLLSKAQPYLLQVLRDFVDAFYQELFLESDSKSILDKLTPAELEQLKQRQHDHLHFILAPDTSRDAVRKWARRLGVIHLLVGVSSGLLTRAAALYRQMLVRHLNQALLPARARYRTFMIVDIRLQDDIQTELDQEEAVWGRYFSLFSEAMPQQGDIWADASAQELQRLAGLPGISAALLVRLGNGGTFKVVNSAGPEAENLTQVLQKPGMEVAVDSASPLGQNLCAEAWRNRQILSSASLQQDPRYETWLPSIRPLGIRSAIAIPILGAQGQCEAVLSIYGAYPNQFEPSPMQQFGMSLKQRWEEVWQRCTSPVQVIPEDQARALRQQLFSGALRMVMQPIIDLATGKLVKLEALARLERDGELVSPDVFLPLLGDAELNRLFCMGLNEALKQAAQWDQQGLSVDVSVNLPPCALLEPDMPRWVVDALNRHGIESRRLTLELLETQSIDSGRRDLLIDELRNLGVRLAMDDLGAGYSSLLRLSRVPFDTIKIDQDLLVQIRNAPIQTISLIASIIQMGHDFDQEVIVEGIREVDMIEAVALLGADMGQGYGLAEPMPAADVQPWQARFEFPIHPGEIHTFLGALTYHWWYFHHVGRDHPASEAECPFTAFLAERGLQENEVAHWHARVHADGEDREASDKMMAWLIERVRTELGS